MPTPRPQPPVPYITVLDVALAFLTALVGAVAVVGAGYLYLWLVVPEQTATGLEAG